MMRPWAKGAVRAGEEYINLVDTPFVGCALDGGGGGGVVVGILHISTVWGLNAGGRSGKEEGMVLKGG